MINKFKLKKMFCKHRYIIHEINMSDKILNIKVICESCCKILDTYPAYENGKGCIQLKNPEIYMKKYNN